MEIALLRFSHPSFVRLVARGAWLVFSGHLAALIVAGLAVAAARRVDPFITRTLTGAVYLLTVVGAFQLTTPDPAFNYSQSASSFRRLARVALLIGLLSIPFDMATMAVEGFTQQLTFKILKWLLSLTAVAGQIALLAYVEILADRIPDERVVSTAAQLKRAFGFTSFFVLIECAVFDIIILIQKGASPRGATWATAASCIFVVGLLLLLIISIALLFMYFRLASLLRREAMAAAANWSE
jgi:hypothetical protein